MPDETAPARRPFELPRPPAATAEASAGADARADVAKQAPGADPASLPQTHDMPAASGPAFTARVEALWEAIVQDDPDRAMPAFFPARAYTQVKDVGDPEADWKHRLVAAYRRDIHSLHVRLGANAARAKLIGVEVPSTRARWVEPGEEWNKLGYYRVFGSRLRYEAGGRDDELEIKSLISWRGEWFVVHLRAVR
jgi:hypothetical protein